MVYIQDIAYYFFTDLIAVNKIEIIIIQRKEMPYAVKNL